MKRFSPVAGGVAAHVGGAPRAHLREQVRRAAVREGGHVAPLDEISRGGETGGSEGLVDIPALAHAPASVDGGEGSQAARGAAAKGISRSVIAAVGRQCRFEGV